jgi:hypothetical protein
MAGGTEDLKNRFTFHPVQGDQAERYQKMREKLLELALLIEEVTPQSREQSLAFTNLEQAGFWANAAIARNEKEG